MKIIEHGKIPDMTIRFACSRCGCIFEANYDEYDCMTSLYIQNVLYYCKCPQCGQISYPDKSVSEGESK